MTSLVVVFLLALLLSFVLTPAVRRVAHALRILDQPTARKVHQNATPRAGGVAIYLAFTLTFVAALVVNARPLATAGGKARVLAFLAGGTVAFLLGLWDDIRSIRPRYKFIGQIAAAVIAYLGGMQIVKLGSPEVGEFTLQWLALPATVLWFVFIINALNLIDGLDGLAAGITLFASLILLVVLDSSSRFLVAIGFAGLAGTTLGFLRYNFHPASIFLGDSGSYFLGYTLAALSILGSIKSEATVAMLIPIIALGVPVIDALWALIRRFILGQRLFHPDADHIHHRLLKLGYTHRRAVLLLYGITVVMGLVALAMVHARNDRAAIILVLIGAAAFIGIRKLGYLAYIHRERLVGWLGTVSDELGLRRNRRSFLECQVSISQSTGMADLRRTVAAAAQFLELDDCHLTVAGCSGCGNEWCEFRRPGAPDPDTSDSDPHRTLLLSLPLVHHGMTVGCLKVARQMQQGPANPYLMRRIDQLRGTIAETLHRLYGTHFDTNGGSQLPGHARGPRAHVLFLTHYFPPEGNAPAARVHALCKDWVRQGQEVTVVTCAPNVPNGVVYDGYANKLYQREVLDGIETIRIWTYLAANRGTGRRIVNYLSYMISAALAALRSAKPDIIIATSPQLFCGWAGVIVSRLRRVPLILEVRDIWPASIVTVGAMRNRWLVRFLEWLEAKMYAAADHIVTVGEGYREELLKKGVPPDKLTVIPNGVDRDLFLPCESQPQLRLQWKLGLSFVCAYVGTVGMACGLDVLLRAGRLLRARDRMDIKFLVVGDGAAQAELAHQAAESGLGNVIFTGRQSKAAIPAILATVDASLVHLKKRPLFATVMPSKIFEAAAMAKPIILGVQGHAAALVERAGCGICIEPENETALVDAVVRLADERQLAAELGRRGHDYFVEHFDRSMLAGKYLDLIHRLRARAAAGMQGRGDPTRRASDPEPEPLEAFGLPVVLHSPTAGGGAVASER
ncbi:MAG TPA: glycosyltransferase [Candidatus Margulisiibacteriota bacterium]|nr:glycosyltransferase [Candidatus Margulisiibacteriota bacterium]